MANSTDTQAARTGLRRTLHDVDVLEQRLQRCGNQDLCSTLQRIRWAKLRQGAAFIDWLEGRDAGAKQNVVASSAAVAHPPSLSARGNAEAAVIERRQVSEDLIVLRVQRPPQFDFLPGQSTKLGFASLKRRYSIASAPGEPFLEFFIELVPGGEMSGQLRRLKAGDLISVDAPKGSFLLDENFSKHLMIATVTGISPFISILRHQFAARNRQTGQFRLPRFFVMQGASYQDEFGYREELENLARAFPEQIIYIPTVSRADEARNTGWAGALGRVGNIAEENLGRFSLDAQSSCIYACGNPGMVDGVEQQFREKGFTVRTERYS